MMRLGAHHCELCWMCQCTAQIFMEFYSDIIVNRFEYAVEIVDHILLHCIMAIAVIGIFHFEVKLVVSRTQGQWSIIPHVREKVQEREKWLFGRKFPASTVEYLEENDYRVLSECLKLLIVVTPTLCLKMVLLPLCSHCFLS